MAKTITRDELRRAIEAANTECRDSEIAANQLTKMGYTNVHRYAEGTGLAGGRPPAGDGRGGGRVTRLLHISASPRGAASASLAIADEFGRAYEEANPDHAIEHWDLWDGTLPDFGHAAVTAKMTVFGGQDPSGDAAAAWGRVRETFARFDRADRLLFSVPMWNGAIPYILKQFIDVISQPGMVFGVDPYTGYEHLLAGRGKRAAVIYTSAVWGPQLGPEFGTDFQSTYLGDWLRWTGIDDITEIRYHPTLTGDADAAMATAREAARQAAATFGRVAAGVA